MKITTDKIVSISEANQNFSKTARLADKLGEVFIFKNNKPKYRITVIEDETNLAELPDDEENDDEVNEKRLSKILKVVRKYPKELKELLKIFEK